MYVRIQYAFYMKTILAIKRAHAFEHTHTHTQSNTPHARIHRRRPVCMYVCHATAFYALSMRASETT